MHLLNSTVSQTDKRKRQLERTDDGTCFEGSLRRNQVKLLERMLAETAETAVNSGLAVNLALGKNLSPAD